MCAIFQKEVGVDVANDFEPEYEVSEGKNPPLLNLKTRDNCEKIYLATDPDREGRRLLGICRIC